MPARYIDNPLPVSAERQIVERDAARYALANTVMMELHKYRRHIRAEDYKTIREMALDGDTSGAQAYLREILKKGCN